MCSPVLLRLVLLLFFLTETIFSHVFANQNFGVVSTTNPPISSDNTAELKNKVTSLESELSLVKETLNAYSLNLSYLEENKKFQETQFASLQKIIQENQQSHFSLIQKILETHDLKSSKQTVSNENLPKNCKEVQQRGHNTSNVYFIQPKTSHEPVLVLCNMETRGGGWTYILNRFNGSQSFDQNWQGYKYGFGVLDGEFWLGLENIHYITGSEFNELLVELVHWNLQKAQALYSSFSIGDEQEGYSLKLLRGYSGDAGDSFTFHLGMKFSTKDNDQDLWSRNCAEYSPSGWWYKDCDKSQLTGRYLGATVEPSNYYKGMYWNTFHGNKYSLKEARMMVRPVG